MPCCCTKPPGRVQSRSKRIRALCEDAVVGQWQKRIEYIVHVSGNEGCPGDEPSPGDTYESWGFPCTYHAPVFTQEGSCYYWIPDPTEYFTDTELLDGATALLPNFPAWGETANKQCNGCNESLSNGSTAEAFVAINIGPEIQETDFRFIVGWMESTGNERPTSIATVTQDYTRKKYDADGVLVETVDDTQTWTIDPATGISDTLSATAPRGYKYTFTFGDYTLHR